MKYRILIEAELGSVADAGEAMRYLTGKLGGTKLRLIEVRYAGERSGMVRRSAPDKREVLEYFKGANLPFEDDPCEEAGRFYAYNEAAGWPRGFEWKKMADRWITRLYGRGGMSFDADEFFRAAVDKSNREGEKA